jgi:hypothetical protein
MNFTIKELNELIYSLGITATNGRLCDKELNASLLDRLQYELCSRVLSEVKEEVDREFSSHFVSNKEADEDTKVNDKFNGVSQFILDFVEANDVVSFTEMNDMYKAYTKGSNSFSHILKALRIPYKNRPTQRYLVKTIDGKYKVRIAGIHNWVVSDYDYKTFNEAPYGE